MALHLQAVAPAQGARWVRLGFRVFVRRPMAFSSLLLAYLFASLLLSVVVPVVGSVVALMAIPLLSLGFMIATRSSLEDGPVHPGQLVAPLRVQGPRRKTLLKLCALYGGLTLLVLVAADLVIGDAWERVTALYGSHQATPEQVRDATGDPRLMWGFGLQALLISLLSVPFWHAPALVLWGDQGMGQALFSSTLGVWRAKGAFTVYALVWAGVVVALGLLASLLFSLLGAPQMAPVAAIPIALMCMTAFYATLYFTFVDTFALEH